jgi:SAM-dependent methyltransferase
MGSENHHLYIEQHRSLFKGPMLEIGSKDYGDTASLRSLFDGEDFIGLDMLEGVGVDHVLDLTLPFEEVEQVLGNTRFETIFCLSVLEHCDNPFKMAENLTQLLAPGGTLYVSVPMSWKFHGYPSDYWRFTHKGIEKLFPGISFPEQTSKISSDMPGDFRDIDEDLGKIRISASWQWRHGHPLRGLSAALLNLLGALGIWRWITRHRYLMPPIMLDMIGQKTE